MPATDMQKRAGPVRGDVHDKRRDARRSPGRLLRATLRSTFPSRADARNTGWGMMAEAGRVVTSGLSFFLLARALGPIQFGQFAGVLALISVFFPFATLGAGNLLIMRVARDRRVFSAQWSVALSTLVVGGVVSAGLVVMIGRVLLPGVPLALLVTLAVSELILSSLVEIEGQVFQAHDRMQGMALLRNLLGVSRLVAIGVLFGSGVSRTLVSWAPLYLAATMATAAVGFFVVTRCYGSPSGLPRSLAGIGQGVPFAFGAASAEVQDDIDKTLLVRFGLLGDAGVYAVAYRLVSFVFLPVRAMLFASYPSFFRAGAEGVRSATRLARRLIILPIIYTATMGVLVALGAGVFAHLLGPQYQSAAGILRWLIFLPVLRVLQYFPADALTGSGHQKLRAGLQTSTAVLNVVLNVLLIPHLGWRGPAIATFASELLFAALLWSALTVIGRREESIHATMSEELSRLEMESQDRADALTAQESFAT